MVSANDVRLGQSLGWFSVGLGLAELWAPRAMARAIGAPESGALLRVAGAREIVTGLGLLGAPEARGWRWARVAGDLMDLALLGAAAGREGAERRKLRLAALGVLGVAALDVASAAAARPGPSKGPPRASVTIRSSPEVCYRAWSDVHVLRRVMSFTRDIEDLGGRRTRWTASVDGKVLRWEAVVTEDVPGERLAWRTLPGGDLRGEGVVSFRPAPAGRGCVVTLEQRMSGPRLLNKGKAKIDLQRFKQWLETGTIPTTQGQPAGARSALGRLAEKGERR